jgi:hypothetical protein
LLLAGVQPPRTHRQVVEPLERLFGIRVISEHKVEPPFDLVGLPLKLGRIVALLNFVSILVVGHALPRAFRASSVPAGGALRLLTPLRRRAARSTTPGVSVQRSGTASCLPQSANGRRSGSGQGICSSSLQPRRVWAPGSPARSRAAKKSARSAAATRRTSGAQRQARAARVSRPRR